VGGPFVSGRTLVAADCHGLLAMLRIRNPAV